MQAELLRRYTEDQAIRDRLVVGLRDGAAPDPAVIASMVAVDSANTAWLQGAVERLGWPDRATIGDSGATAAFILVQHADQDTAFQARMLLALTAAYRRGEVDAQSVALLTDRVATARGEEQVYGTQTDMRDGRFVPKPIRDAANVDARRASVGLPPMREYLRVLDSVYLGRRAP
jgi:hypothetical protein